VKSAFGELSASLRADAAQAKNRRIKGYIHRLEPPKQSTFSYIIAEVTNAFASHRGGAAQAWICFDFANALYWLR
jgi:hypothetical protein